MMLQGLNDGEALVFLVLVCIFYLAAVLSVAWELQAVRERATISEHRKNIDELAARIEALQNARDDLLARGIKGGES